MTKKELQNRIDINKEKIAKARTKYTRSVSNSNAASDALEQIRDLQKEIRQDVKLLNILKRRAG